MGAGKPVPAGGGPVENPLGAPGIVHAAEAKREPGVRIQGMPAEPVDLDQARPGRPPATG